jgi:hypothetical protein
MEAILQHICFFPAALVKCADIQNIILNGSFPGYE